jgi:hypothetical protein
MNAMRNFVIGALMVLGACGGGHTGFGCDIGGNDLTTQICDEVTAAAKCESHTYVQRPATVCVSPRMITGNKNCCEFVNCASAPMFPDPKAPTCN